MDTSSPSIASPTSPKLCLANNPPPEVLLPPPPPPLPIGGDLDLSLPDPVEVTDNLEEACFCCCGLPGLGDVMRFEVDVV